ncbi:MAG: hypothetical protein CVV27_11050, partial [Candidatus Melainabacteria bacterium HGW-Melainabacteria-1]
MAIDALYLFTSLTTGAAVGYITNTLAIRMLFKEYPLIGGGEIIKSREELAVAMSELVEERLITPDTLLEEFEKEAFKRSFEQLIRQIIAHHLKQQVLRLDRPADLRGYSQTLANLRHFLREHREQVLEACLGALFGLVQAEDLFGPEQQESVLGRLWELLLTTLETHADEIGDALRTTLAGLRSGELLPPELLEKLLPRVFEGLEAALGEANLLSWLEQLLQELGIESLLSEIETILRQRSLAQLLGGRGSRELALRLLGFLNTPRGEQLLEELLRHGGQLLKKLDLPLRALLHVTLEQRLLELLERWLPPLLVQLEHWAAENRIELEELVQSAIQEHLRGESLVKHMTATLFSDQISSRYQIVEKVLDEIKAIASQSGPELIQLSTRFLDHTTVGQVVTYLEKHAIEYTALSKTLLRLLNAYLPRLDLGLLDPLLQRPLGSFSLLEQLHLPALWQRYAWPWLQTALQERGLAASGPALQNLLLRLWQDWQDRPLADWLAPDDLAAGTRWLLPILRQPPFKRFMLRRLSESLPELLQQRSIEDLLTPRVRTALWERLGHLYEHRLDGFLDAFQQEKMDGLYHQLADVFFNLAENEQVATQLREVLVSFMIDLIRDNRLFHGRIAIAVRESFARFSDDEMRQEMESFMGKELQPITLLGAVLGGLVGVGTAAVATVPGLTPLFSGWPALLSMPLIYSLTGIGTNWQAIVMLFRPYRTFYWPFSHRRLPFSPGVFARNKPALASSMARFIDQKLLSKQNMVEILERYHHRWKEVIQKVISRNDYAVWNQRFREATRENYDLLTPLLLDLGFEQVYRLRAEIAVSIIGEAREIRLNQADLALLHDEIQSVVGSSEPYFQRFLNQRTEDWLQRNYPLADELDPELLDWLQSRLQAGTDMLYQQLAQRLAGGELLQLIAQLPLGALPLQMQLEQLVPGRSLPKQQAVRYVLDWIRSEALQREIRLLLEQGTNHLLGRGQTLGALWNGQLLKLLRAESDPLLDILSSYVLELARQNKERIAKAVVSDVQRQGMLEIMLVNFGGIRQDVYQVVDVVVERKLGDFLAEKLEPLKHWWHQLLETQLPGLSLADLGLPPDILDLDALQQILQEDILANPRTFELLTELADGIGGELLRQLDLGTLLDSLELNSLAAVELRFSAELELAQRHLSSRLQELPALKSSVADLTWRLLESLALTRRPAELL